jgi:hypothetical protein
MQHSLYTSRRSSVVYILCEQKRERENGGGGGEAIEERREKRYRQELIFDVEWGVFVVYQPKVQFGDKLLLQNFYL